MTSRRYRAATMIQAMARGVVGRELASDERNRQNRIHELLLNALKRLGGPVLREWHEAACMLHQVRSVHRLSLHVLLSHANLNVI